MKLEYFWQVGHGTGYSKAHVRMNFCYHASSDKANEAFAPLM